MLSEDQIRQFRDEEYTIARGVLDGVGVAALTGELDAWIDESRAHSANYGETLDGKARFDLEAGHGAEQPRLRRVANPVDVSEAYRQALFDGPIPDRVAELIGPDVKFHHCKLNIKLPGMATRVEYHQDHAYDPHTNSDMVTTLLLLDDMSEANGCLRVVPGSHRERHSHYRDGKFVGAIDPALDADFEARSVPIEGSSGDVALMHTWTVHGGGPNRSDRPRRLLICDYVAADAFPLTAPAVPSPYNGRIVRGKPARKIRLVADSIELPQAYQDDSFFGLQGQKGAEDA
jgi:ectoine hydroxylase-related dioxygenase (phytanoyl-CoA dioxygenase family)